MTYSTKSFSNNSASGHPLRIIVFADKSGKVPWHLMNALKQSLTPSTGESVGEIVAICGLQKPSKPKYAFRWLNIFYNRFNYIDATKRFAKKNDIPFLLLKEGQGNDKSVIFHLKKCYKPTTVMSFYFTDIYSPYFIGCFDQLVNYHNGLLPKYKGLKATCWAILKGEKEVGYTFHYIRPEIDAGNILIQQTFEIRVDERSEQVDARLVTQAAQQMPALLEMLRDQVAGDSQTGDESYFSYKDYRKVKFLHQPHRLACSELLNIIRAFGPINIKFNNRFYGIKKLIKAKSAKQKKGRHYFYSSDDVLIEASPFTHNQYWFYKSAYTCRHQYWPKLKKWLIR